MLMSLTTEGAEGETVKGSEPELLEDLDVGGEEEGEEERIITLEEYVFRDPLLFGDYRNALDEEETRYYEDLLDYEAVYFLFQEILDEYIERLGKKISIVLFEDCLEHLTRATRLLRMRRAHAMLVGVGGGGKKSIARLAAFAAGSSRQFVVPRGLNVHIGRIHKNDLAHSQPAAAVPAATNLNPPRNAQVTSNFDLLASMRRNIRVLKHIPKGARCMAAGKLSHLIDLCVESNGRQEWYDLLTFPYSALRVPSSVDQRSLTAKVKDNVNGSAEPIVDDSFLTHRQGSIYRAIEAKVYDGDLRGAVRLLTSDSSLAPSTPETITALKEKHPTPSRPLSFPPEPNISSPFLSVTVSDVADAVDSFYSGSAAGLDGLRPQHLKELISVSAGDNGHKLLESLNRLCNFLLKGMLNLEVCPYLYGASLCALSKSDGGIRPIAVGSVFRRLVAKVGGRAVKSEMSVLLQPHQLGYGTALGCEAAIHATRSFAMTGCENASNDIILKVDLKNAFNSIERDGMLSKIQEHIPTLYPFLSQCYSLPSQLFYDSESISSQVGAQQGDPLGPLIFSLAINDVVKSLASPLNVWYLDDGTIGGNIDTVEKDMKAIIDMFKEMGLELNSNKCELFCCSPNIPNLSTITNLFPGIKLLDKANFTVLGAPIFPEGVPPLLDGKREGINKTVSGLKQLPAHVALTIFRCCLSMPKLTYALRTSPVWLFPANIANIDNCIKNVLEQVLNIKLEGDQWRQAALPIRHGGLGIRRVKETGLSAFLSSAHGVVDLVTRILSINGDGFRLPFVTEALEGWEAQCPGKELPDHLDVQKAWDDVLCKSVLDKIMESSIGVDLARVRASSKPESGSWLHALPSPQMGTLLDDDSLRIAVALRLGCDICEQHHCICGALVDSRGHHGLSCPKCAGRFPRHHALNDLIKRAMVMANIPCVLEPPAVETSGVWGGEAKALIRDLGRRIASRGHDRRSGSYLAQRLSLAIQRGCEMFEIVVTRNYSENSFREDLKRLYYQLGLEDKKTCFLFTASQILEESFLEYINSILLVGIPPALFSDEERDAVVGGARAQCVQAGLGQSKDAVWQYFVNKCCDNLHVVLTMSPSGDVLRNRCRSFPGLVNNTTIDWMFPWPKQALLAVANVFLANVDKIPDEFRPIIVEHVVHVHLSVSQYTEQFLLRLRRRNYVTPTHYMDYLTNYVALLNEKDAYIVAMCERLKGGLSKIAEANIQLEDLNAKLAEQKVIVEEQTKECELLLKEISTATDAAVSKQQVAAVKQVEITAQSAEIGVEKASAEETLAAAMPALEAARLALADLEKADITEIRSFASPPEAVQVVCECVAILRGVKDISWKGAKGIMADPNFLRTLQEMNCDLITQKQVKDVKAHMKKSKKLDTMQQISKAGYGLLKFVQAVLGYCAVYREVKPKKERVEQLEKEYQEAVNYLNTLNREIARLQKTLDKLNEKYNTAMLRRQELQEETDIMMRRLIAADKLMSGLASEQKRWTEELEARKCNKTNNAIVIRNVARGTISIAATRGRCQIATAELISADSGALLRSEACSFAASRSLTRESRDVAPLRERDATKQVNIACAVIARDVSRLREIAEPLRYF
ncbi:unnamed protein product [Plutella xylostella]|uniref:(diamondback moth) hypothetical protein n=1 Tax=Plutella xylostella TaxID=51655 RepID=A0A8S4G9U5_PLUXY|nr:unnamed protein product [Plutella xylostella]